MPTHSWLPSRRWSPVREDNAGWSSHLTQVPVKVVPDSALLAAARAAVASWSIDVRDLRLVSRSENYAFRVEATDGSLFVLRLHRPGYHTHEELLSEQTWTAALREAGIDVPIPVLTARGEGYATAVVADEKRYAGVLEWVPGETLGASMEDAQAGFVDDCYARIGGAMAALHSQASEWHVPDGFARHAFDAGGLMGVGGRTPFWGPFWESGLVSAEDRSLLGDLREGIGDTLANLDRTRNTYSMIHADLHPANVVVSGDRLHLIDFDDSGFGWHAYDFAVCLGAHAGLPRRQAAFLEGYRGVRDPDDHMVALIPLFLLIRSLVSIGWITARPDLARPHAGKELMAWVRANWERMLAAVDEGG